MTAPSLPTLLKRYRAGDASLKEVTTYLKKLPFADFGDTKTDLHRHLRRDLPEAIYGRGKTAPQILKMAKTLQEDGQAVLITKLDQDQADVLMPELPGFVYHPKAAMMTWVPKRRKKSSKKPILVLTAGTTDIPIAQETLVTLETLGIPTEALFDVGVAGLHRLLKHLDVLERARAIVVVAGMDGALPSVVSGLTAVPVIAVPTSVGYGAAFEGIAPLLTMLNSCSPGVVAVNIDNGFGAGIFAAMLCQQ